MDNDYSQQLKEFLTLIASKRDGVDLSFDCAREGDSYFVKIINNNTENDHYVLSVPAYLVKKLIESRDIDAQKQIVGIIFKPGPKSPNEQQCNKKY